MTPPTAPSSTIPAPSGPAPVMPPDVSPLDGLENPGPTLQDAVITGTRPPQVPEPEPDAPPMSTEQIIGVVAEVSAFGLPAGLTDAYKADFKANQLVQLGVQMSGLAEALAAYGVTAGGGRMPEWLSVALGVAVLGYGVYATRSKYVIHPDVDVAATDAAVRGFAGPYVDSPLQTANLGFSDASVQGGDSFAAP